VEITSEVAEPAVRAAVEEIRRLARN